MDKYQLEAKKSGTEEICLISKINDFDPRWDIDIEQLSGCNYYINLFFDSLKEAIEHAPTRFENIVFSDKIPAAEFLEATAEVQKTPECISP